MSQRFLLFGLLIAAAAAGADDRSAPSLLHAPASVEAAATRLLPWSTAGRSIILPEPSSAERATLKRANAVSPRASRTAPSPRPPLAIGFPRIPGPGDRVIDLASLAWIPVEGGAAAVITLTSPSAAAVRLQLRLNLQPRADARIELRFAGSNGRQVFGPYAPKDLEGPGLGWSPVLEGDTGTVEIFVAGPQEAAGVIEISQIAHLAATPADLLENAAKRVSEIGSSGACEVDVACRMSPTPAYLHQATSSAQIVFTPASVFHYPAGDLEKYSIGMTGSGFFGSGAASFIQVVYSSGSTEGGSSGSGLLTQNANGDYELRGGLYGGTALCSNPTGFDIYSRFDLACPSIASYLTPSPCPYTLSPLDLSNSAAGGGATSITVTAPAGCPVTAASYQPWVTVIGITPGSGTSTVALQISRTPVQHGQRRSSSPTGSFS